MARKINNSQKEAEKIIYIHVDGECEQDYLNQLAKQEESICKLEIVPKLKKGNTLNDIYNNLIKLAKEGDYHKIFWIIDYDQINKQGKGNTLNQYIDNFNKQSNHYQKKYPGFEIKILINNPCLEFWYLLHYKETSQHFLNQDSVIKELKKYLSDYCKEEKYRKTIYTNLKNKQNTAIDNANKLLSEGESSEARADIVDLITNNFAKLKKQTVI